MVFVLLRVWFGGRKGVVSGWSRGEGRAEEGLDDVWKDRQGVLTRPGRRRRATAHFSKIKKSRARRRDRARAFASFQNSQVARPSVQPSQSPADAQLAMASTAAATKRRAGAMERAMVVDWLLVVVHGWNTRRTRQVSLFSLSLSDHESNARKHVFCVAQACLFGAVGRCLGR